MEQDSKAEFAKWALTGEDIVSSYQHILEGEIVEPVIQQELMPDGTTTNVQVNQWTKKGTPLLSDEGIQQLTTTLLGFLNRSVFLSNLTEKRAMGLAQDILLTVNKKLLLSVKDFGLKTENYEQIITQLEGLMIPSLLRAFEEGERKFYAKTTQEIIQRIGSDKAQQPQGVFN